GEAGSATTGPEPGRSIPGPGRTHRRVFTGRVEAKSRARAVEARGEGLRLWIEAPGEGWSPRGGESVCVSGACLSVAGLAEPGTGTPRPGGGGGADLGFDLSAETLARTWFKDLRPGRLLNLERSLLVGDRLDGHLVTGHVDGQG